MNENIYVTKPFLPDIEEYISYVQGIWERSHLTNQGPLLQQFEAEVSTLLNVSQFHFLTNGTIALQIAIRSLGIDEGEIITTPFSYVATTSSILWEHCMPVFVDIEPETFCIDPAKIEAAITPDTKAIMAVHVFGFPCAVEEIEAIANKHNIKVIYDGAHAFGAAYKGKSLLNFGDIAMCSFHATKVLHTIEGGGLIVKDEEVHKVVELMKRFGHQGDDHYMLGINGKASEFQAAMGLVNLKHLPSIIERRKLISELYDDLLTGSVEIPKAPKDLVKNYAYYPVLFKDEKALLKVVEACNAVAIFPRRYFYPSLNTLPYLESKVSCPVSEDIASRILCLPLYPELDEASVHRIVTLIKEAC